MNDYTAFDIHQLDQAYPAALADLEEFIGNPVHKRRLAEVGPEVFAAEQTRDLAFSIDNPMSLAGWAAIATVRLMEAGRAWEEDTDAAWAKVDELTAALAEKDAQLTAANRRADGLQADLDSATKANTAWANENLRLREQVFAQKPVIKAAQAWAEMCDDGGIDATGTVRKAEDALYDAVESYRLMDLALTTARDEAGAAA